MHARRIALILAGDEGPRFGGGVPDEYAQLDGKTLLARTLDRLSGALTFDATFVVLARDDSRYRPLFGERKGVVPLYCGGVTRAETVANALAAIASLCADTDWMLVHDAVRPCVPIDALLRLVDELAADPVGGLLAIPVADTLKCADHATPARVLHTKDRAGLWQAQAPQMFRYGILRDALARTESSAAADEAEAVEALAATGACALPTLVVGSALNVKVASAADLALARAILASQEQP